MGEKKVSVAPPSNVILTGKGANKAGRIKVCKTKVILPAVSIFICNFFAPVPISPGKNLISSEPKKSPFKSASLSSVRARIPKRC